MSYCTSCGHELLADGQACEACGQLVYVQPVAMFEAPAEGALFSEVSEVKREKISAEAREARAELRRARVAERKAEWRSRLVKAKEWSASHKPLVIPVATILFLAGGYGITQSIITSLSGPEAKITAYLNVIKMSNWAALQDTTLFPGAYGNESPLLRDSFDHQSVADASFGDVHRTGNTATAVIYSDASHTHSYEIRLQARETWNAIFSVPVWAVVSEPPTTSLAIDTKLVGSQNIDFNDTRMTVAKLRDAWELKQQVSVLPGFYKTTSSPIGFYTENTSYHDLWTADENRTISIDAPTVTLSSSVLSTALGRAGMATRMCERSKCSQLPHYKDTDFSLWSQYTRDTYTSSVFSVKFTGSSCTQQSVTVTAYNRATIDYYCGITAHANLYVKYVYYYGYYSNYYYYWNFKDTKETNVNPRVTVGINPTGTTVSIIKTGWK
jgi:hypothetical protein